VHLVFGEVGDVHRLQGRVGGGERGVGGVHAVQVSALLAGVGIALATLGPLDGLAGRQAQPQGALGGAVGEGADGGEPVDGGPADASCFWKRVARL
jgi:hypothetical protein